jgi:ABC-type sugar transport system permease subunit
MEPFAPTIVFVLILISVIGMALIIGGLLQRRPVARYIALFILFLISTSGGALTLHQWGFYSNFEAFTATVTQHWQWLLGYGIAIALYQLGTRDTVWLSRTFIRHTTMFIVILTTFGLLHALEITQVLSTMIVAYQQPLTWIATLATIFASLLAYLLLRDGERFGETERARTAVQAWMFLAPNLIGFAIFFAGPLLYSLVISFTDATIGTTGDFVGLANYSDILGLDIRRTDAAQIDAAWSPLFTLGDEVQGWQVSARDSLFWISLGNTLLLCILLIPTGIIPALALALLLNTNLRGMKFFRAVFFLPSIAAVVGAAVVWRWLYDPVIGTINYIITQFVTFLNATFGISLQDPRIEWLTEPGVVLFSLLLLIAWQTIGFNMVLFLAGLQNIPRELYEVAWVDGADERQQFWYITLPLLMPTSLFVMVTTLISALQTFNEPFVLLTTDSPLIPVEGSTLVYALYQRAFTRFEFGYSSAMAWLLVGVIFTITLLQFRFLRPQAYQET